MATSSNEISISVAGEHIAGTFLAPGSHVPGVLFVHGWGGSQQSDLDRARAIAALGCVCLTFDLRGHGDTLEERMRVTREDNLQDLLAAYDLLARHPAIDPDAVAVIGCSYGGYLSTVLTSMRPVRWLALQAPALYRDANWGTPKLSLDRKDLNMYRQSMVTYEQNRALAACERFHGDVLLVESENDTYVPHETYMNYRTAFRHAHSLSHRVLDGADHGLSTKEARHAYSSILTAWITEMVMGARVGGSDNASRDGAVRDNLARASAPEEPAANAPPSAEAQAA